MKRTDTKHVLDDIARDSLTRESNLLPGIMANIEQGNRLTMQTRFTIRFAAVLLAVILLIAFFSLPGPASALRGWMGFIPGFGRVDQSAALRVLATPVSSTRDGYTITVESALLDAARTVLVYRVSGPVPTYDDPARRPQMCQEYPRLRLPDGQELTYPRRENSQGGGESHWQDSYAAVPAGVEHAVLSLPCLAELPKGQGPRNWEIELRFAPAPAEMTVFPVIEATANPPQTSQATTAGQMTLALDNLAALDEGYYLQASLAWENDPALLEVQFFPNALHLFGPDGQESAIWPVDQLAAMAPGDALRMELNLQTGPLAPSPNGEAARLVLDYVGVRQPANAKFTLDAGSSPQPGQTWQLDQTLDVNGYALRVVSAETIQSEPGQPAMLMLHFKPGKDVMAVTAIDSEHPVSGTGGSPAGEDGTGMRAGWYYQDGFPQGVIQVEITSILVRRTGPWSLNWQPPAVTGTQPAPVRSTPSAGLTGQCPQKPVPGELPAGLGGRVAYSSGAQYELFIANLDGSSQVALGPGLFPDIDPGGNRVVYRALDAGFIIYDLTHAAGTPIAGTGLENLYDNWPRWSPDGRQIAFDRVTGHAADIYVVNDDGSGLRALLAGPEDESLLGWADGGRQVIYRVTTAEGQSIRRLNLADGSSQALALIPGSATFSRLSPDGARLVFTNEQGIFLQVLDSSAPQLLVGGSEDFGNPIWSPDGMWILMPYWAADQPAMALLQPESCQFIQRISAVGDLLSSWVK